MRVGVVGGGQLARMMGEVAHQVNVRLSVLAASAEDAALDTCDVVLVGEARDAGALARLARGVDVVTFDHELIDLEQIRQLETLIAVRPDARALAFAVDKAHQRSALAAAGLAVPRHLVLDSPDDPRLGAFLAEVGPGAVVKVARGGYDGRGVIFCDDDAAVRDALGALGARAVIEQRLTLRAELSQVLVRDVRGAVALYPLVETIQRDGMCVETRFPAHGDHGAAAAALATRIAELCGVVGVLAVELFVTDDGLLVNELALRPHNTAHWTIEGAATSQFANHLLAVSGQALGPTDATCSAAVMVNVVGAERPGSRDAAQAVTGAHVHDYAKTWRPGRKLGHVTVLGPDAHSAHVTAWKSARAFGTSAREA